VRPRLTVALVALWAVSVGVVAVVTWTVIDAAGHHVLDESALPTVGSGTSPASQPGRRGHGHRAGPTRTPTAGPTDHPAPPSRPSRPARPSPQPPTPSATASTAPTHGHPTPGHPEQFTHTDPPHGGSPSPPATPAPPPEATDSWHGAAGTVTVTCDGSLVRLQGATPSNGYRVEVEQEDGAVVVQFERDDPEDEVHVRATCVDGRPRFDVADGRPSRPHDPERSD
jgi:hypothetical protein